jgi:hypothetical protein
MNDIAQDLTVDQYAQVDINGRFELDMYYNTHQDCVYAIYNEQTYEVNASATLKQFLAILLMTDHFSVQIYEPFNEQFTSEPLDKTLREIQRDVGVFQCNVITYPPSPPSQPLM